MKAADVLVSAAPVEGRPNAVLEAMACSCPLVVSDIAAHHEILSERTAVFVPHHDPDAIATGIAAAQAHEEVYAQVAVRRAPVRRRSATAAMQ